MENQKYNHSKTNGLIAVFTGDGKGKTTASLGLAFRALGHGHRVCIIQFIKGSWKYGELETAKQFSSLLDFHVMGRGFTWKSDDLEKDKKVALEAWSFAKEVIRGNKYSMVILDELTYLSHYKILEEDVNWLNYPLKLIPIKGEITTEIEAIKILTGAESKVIASGGIYGAEGSIMLLIEGSEEQINKLTNLLEDVYLEQNFS